MDETAGQVKVLGKIVRCGRRRRDRVHGDHFHAGGHDAQAGGLVAVHDHDRLQPVLRRRRDAESVVDVVAGERVAGVEQVVVDLDDLVALLAEDLGDFFLALVRVAVVNPAEHAEHEHVLALARVCDQLEAFLLNRQFVHDQSALLEVGECFRVLLADFLLGVFGPHVLEQHDGAWPVGTVLDAGVEDLLVERHHHVSFVAHVGHVLRAHAHADAAGALSRTRGRLDFGRDDLHGPHAVAHLAADEPEQLAAFLCALAGVAYDLDDVLIHRKRTGR